MRCSKTNTLVAKINPTPEQYKLLNNTAVAFAAACEWINGNVNSKLTNRNSIQALCYREVKAKFGLNANHVVRACARVAANRLTAKHKSRKIKGFKPTSFDCDARTFRFISDGYLVSISTTGKRIKTPMRVSAYHITKLKNQNPRLVPLPLSLAVFMVCTNRKRCPSKTLKV